MVRIVMLMMAMTFAHVHGANTTTDDGNATTTTTTTTIKKKTTGGTSTGGTSTGGTSTGGTSTGGTSTGGTSTGGKSTGGNSTGGNSTGGNSTGGSSTGGSSTGGNSTGGNVTGGGKTGKATVFKSELTIAVSDPAKFVNSTKAKDIVAESIADSSTALQRSFVNVTDLSVTGGRRLSVIARRLAASVTAKFTVTFPPGHSKPVLTKTSMNATKMATAMQAKAKAAGINVTVDGVTVAKVEQVSGGNATNNTGTNGASSTSSTTSKTASPSARHFLSIGITTIAIMSLMFAR